MNIQYFANNKQISLEDLKTKDFTGVVIHRLITDKENNTILKNSYYVKNGSSMLISTSCSNRYIDFYIKGIELNRIKPTNFITINIGAKTLVQNGLLLIKCNDNEKYNWTQYEPIQSKKMTDVFASISISDLKASFKNLVS